MRRSAFGGVVLALLAAPLWSAVSLANSPTSEFLVKVQSKSQPRACEMTACLSTCDQIKDRCFKRGGALINCNAQHQRCSLNCTTNCK